MASCKDCVHVEVCSEKNLHVAVGMNITPRFKYKRIEQECEHFKNCALFVELHHAEWIEDEDMYGDPIYHCSNCNEHFVLAEGTPTDNCYYYCPNCGAKMDEQALKEREENA